MFIFRPKEETEKQKETSSIEVKEDFKNTVPVKVLKKSENTVLSLFGDQSWTIWENIDFLDKGFNNGMDWDKKARKVAWFNDLITYT